MKKNLLLIMLFFLPSTAFAAQRTVTIDDATYQVLVDNFCPARGWTATIKDASGNDITNPVTCPQFIDQYLINYAFAVVRDYLAQQAAQTAKSQTEAQVEQVKENAQITVQ